MRGPRTIRTGAVALGVVVALSLGVLPAPASGSTGSPAATVDGGQAMPGSLTYLLAKSTPAVGSVAPRPAPSTRLSTASSTFVVTYHGFPTAAKASFQRAVDLWSVLISSPVPIRIDATWSDLGPGILGGAGPREFWTNFSGAPQPNTWYPVALANARAGFDLSSGDDIRAQFASKRTDWYFGTDGNVPINKLDFTTVVLHEIGHGLGITSSVQLLGSVATWGLDGSPLAYDRLAQSSSGSAVSSFATSSSALATVARSNAMRWGGAQATAANGGIKPRLYSPNPFEQGSSISHLDEDVFPTGDDDALMTPYLDDGEALHDPGDIGLGMLRDLGWTTTGAKGVPGAPSVTSAVPGHGHVTLAWAAPKDTGRQFLTGFRVYRFTDGATTADATYDLAPTALTTSITGLANDTPYRFAVAARNASGLSVPSAKSASVTPIDLAPFAEADALVRQQFRDFAKREPTFAELVTWLDQLQRGVRTSASTVGGIATIPSIYDPSTRVTRLYWAYFQRLPDFSGYSYWTGKLRNGTSLKKVSDTFAASSEFRTKYGNISNGTFVDRVYANVLQRPPDPGGRAYWTRKLDTRSMSRGSVMLSFSESSEFTGKMQSEVNSVLLRAGMLQRMPTPIEHTADVAFLDGPGTLSDLAGLFLALPAYDARIP